MRSKPITISAEVDNSKVEESVNHNAAETAQILQSMSQMIQGLTEAMSRPKQVVRDENGRVVGVH